jgi:hypothetical protein
MQQFGDLRRFMQQPVLNVIGMLGAAGVTKIGYAGLAAEAIMTLLMIYVSAIILSVMVRKLMFWVAGATERRGSIVFRSATRFRRALAMGA